MRKSNVCKNKFGETVECAIPNVHGSPLYDFAESNADNSSPRQKNSRLPAASPLNQMHPGALSPPRQFQQEEKQLPTYQGPSRAKIDPSSTSNPSPQFKVIPAVPYHPSEPQNSPKDIKTKKERMLLLAHQLLGKPYNGSMDSKDQFQPGTDPASSSPNLQQPYHPSGRQDNSVDQFQPRAFNFGKKFGTERPLTPNKT